ncbi:MAG: zinc ribbon domain-containing protein [Methanobacteriaceae archaeon]|nr:zinc ribbon domain-containing protein [Methanobacteriaceae archaeon]
MGENDSPKICRKCNAKIEPGFNFCKECGTPVEDAPVKESPKVSCPNCSAELNPEDTFCTECGKKIETITSCPKCYANLKPGTMFCTECGVNVPEYKKLESENLTSSSSSSSDPLDEVKKTGKGIMKDAEKIGGSLIKEVGGFLDKTTSSSSSKKSIKPQKKVQRFLVCNSCGGYYELLKGEEPEDFADKCDCGGNLECKDTKE